MEEGDRMKHLFALMSLFEKSKLALAMVMLLTGGAIVASSDVCDAAAAGKEESPPPGVKMLLPRGGIPAIFEPEFVSADTAEISDDAWVLGVFFNGEAHAYSLNLLNHHEIVNDSFGRLPVAAVW
jgi:hypothetical protein